MEKYIVIFKRFLQQICQVTKIQRQEITTQLVSSSEFTYFDFMLAKVKTYLNVLFIQYRTMLRRKKHIFCQGMGRRRI